MKIITDISDMQRRSAEARRRGLQISFVPTMGYLHEGHLSLLREARCRGEFLILSIFVNPTQFGAGEDFESYPRDLSRDAAMARNMGVDCLFAPETAGMYPKGYATYVDVEGGLTEGLCGASRPGHFRGVTTVVAKLFNIVQPNFAFFGEKDFQQLAVIKRMSADLNLPVQVVGMPIVREADGLAMSSRNVYLSPEERRQALVLSQAIEKARRMAGDGEDDCGKIIEVLRAMIEQKSAARIDYLKICHQATLQDQDRVDGDSVLLLAVFVGKTRLLDNGFILTGG